MQSIVSHTPVWVWILLIFLLNRGIKALRPREMTPPRMLVLPMLFFVWALYSMATELEHRLLAFACFAAALVAGAAIGWLITMRLPPARFDPGSGLIQRPGTSMTLSLVSIGFLFKYALSVVLAHHLDLASNRGYNVFYGTLSGAVDGVFWGGTLLQLFQAFGRKGNRVRK